MGYKCHGCPKSFGTKEKMYTHIKKEKACFVYLYDNFNKAAANIENNAGHVVNDVGGDYNNVIAGDHNKIDLSKCTNLTINYFRDAEYDFITSEQLKTIIVDNNYKIPQILTELCKQIYFNAEKPYNMSIYLNKDKNNRLIRCTYLNHEKKIDREYPKKFMSLLTDHIAELVVVHMLKSTMDIPTIKYNNLQRTMYDLITGGELYAIDKETKDEQKERERINTNITNHNKMLLKDTVVLMKTMIDENKDSILAKQIIEKLLEDEENDQMQPEPSLIQCQE
jgi:hypothetical protein